MIDLPGRSLDAPLRSGTDMGESAGNGKILLAARPLRARFQRWSLPGMGRDREGSSSP